MPDTIESPVLEVFQNGERLFLRLLAQTIIPWTGAKQMLLTKKHMHSFICLEIQLREVTLKEMNVQQYHHFK